jgi:dolichol-phosphate mannosyltransferase
MQNSSNEDLKQIVVPIYNEGENVLRLYSELTDEKVPYDSLTFVYDFDGDTTLPFIARLAQSDSRVRADKNQYGRGVVNALRWGFAHCKPGPVIVVMGDLSDKLSIIPDMIEAWSKGARVVCPSRYMKGGKQHGGGLVKSLLSRLAGLSLKLIGFPTADPTNNFRLYDGKWLSSQTIESQGGFEVGLELCYKAYRSGGKIVELPTVWRDREMGKSNFKLMAWLPHYLRWYLLTVKEVVRRHRARLLRLEGA